MFEPTEAETLIRRSWSDTRADMQGTDWGKKRREGTLEKREVGFITLPDEVTGMAVEQ